MAKVIITGVECSGKTTLAKSLAEHLGVPYVSEFARDYLVQLEKPYTPDDLIIIAKQQYELIQNAAFANETIICDTGLLVLLMWSQIKYGTVHPDIQRLFDSWQPDLYILPHFDIPFEEDPLRETGGDRALIYQQYLNQLKKLKTPHFQVVGNTNERLASAISVLDTVFSN